MVGTLAPAFGFLLLSRALIGVGTSAAYPTAMALVRKRADAFGIGVPTRVEFFGESLGGRRTLADHPESRLFLENARQSLPEHGVIVDQK